MTHAFLSYALLFSVGLSLATVVSNSIPLKITTSNALPPATVGFLYITRFSATGGNPPYTWRLAFQEQSPYPYGFSFTSNGTMSGTASGPGQYSPRIQVSDSRGAEGVQSFTLGVYPTSVLAINCGGSADGRFDADNSFGTIEGGSTGLNKTVKTFIYTNGTLNPASQKVYQSERYGAPNLVYTVAGIMASGKPRLAVSITYLVRLHFAEIDFTTHGERQFNVAINGQTVLRNFDIVAEAGGPNKALVKEFLATATGIRGNQIGGIIINLTVGKANFPKLSGIEILPATLFVQQTPIALNDNDGRSYELGIKFVTSVPGRIIALRYWKSPSETGPYTGHLWTSFGNRLLASVNFTHETSSGWQEARLTQPVDIDLSAFYVVSVNTNGYFVDTPNGLDAFGVTSGYLSASAAYGNGNGVYGNIGEFPDQSYNNTNYFRDVVFQASV